MSRQGWRGYTRTDSATPYAHDWKVNQGSNEGLMATGGWSSSKMAEHYGKVARASRALAEQQQIMLGRAVSA